MQTQLGLCLVLGLRFVPLALMASLMSKMAQGMGLSRLGGEGAQSAKWTGQWASLTQREVGRRLWWNLVFLDWNIAPSYHYSSSIQPNQSESS